jgi:hypothetical protein
VVVDALAQSLESSASSHPGERLRDRRAREPREVVDPPKPISASLDPRADEAGDWWRGWRPVAGEHVGTIGPGGSQVKFHSNKTCRQAMPAAVAAVGCVVAEEGASGTLPDRVVSIHRGGRAVADPVSETHDGCCSRSLRRCCAGVRWPSLSRIQCSR